MNILEKRNNKDSKMNIKSKLPFAVFICPKSNTSDTQDYKQVFTDIISDRIKEKDFESIKHIDENGVEFWYARELMTMLEYSKWGNFKNVINKAKEARRQEITRQEYEQLSEDESSKFIPNNTNR